MVLSRAKILVGPKKMPAQQANQGLVHVTANAH